MRAICVASLALGTAALAFGASAALADDGNNTTSFGVTVSPSSGEGDAGTPAPPVRAVRDPDSQAGPAPTPHRRPDGSDTAGLGSDAGPGLMKPRDESGDRYGRYDRKAEPASPWGPVRTRQARRVRSRHGMRKPGGGVKGGAGGSFAELSPTQLGVGSTLIAGALGGGFLLLRRRAGGDA